MVIIDGYAIDASLNEQHTFEAEVTDFPIESGSSVTDNVRLRPIRIVIEGVVSDTPMPGPIADRRHVDVTGLNVPLENGLVPSNGAINPTNSSTFLPSDEALAVLLGIREAREPITIQTSLKSFDNMVMTTLEIPRDGETGHALRFTATFQQVIVVTNIRTSIRVAAPNLGAKTKKQGVPVVVVDDGNRGALDTKSGKAAVWNEKKGRYEYGTLYDKNGNNLGVTQPNGVPVPASELTQAKANATQAINARQAAEDATNSTYYDFQTDQWRNTDGSPVTQAQLDAKR